VPYLSVVLTDCTEPFVTCVLIACRELSTCRTASLAFTNGFLLRSAAFVVRETRAASKMSVTVGAGDSEGGESSRRHSHTIATRLVAFVCDVLSHSNFTCF